MKTKILLILFATLSLNRLFAADVVLNNFESGSPTVKTNYNATYVATTNPTISGINTTANCGKIGRTSSNWYEMIYFPASFSIAAGATKYVHIMVKYDAQPDAAIRVDATSAGGDGSKDIRAINAYTNFGQWQDLVFAVTGSKTVIQINYLADMGFNNTPVGRILNNTTKFAYIDEIIVNDSELPRSATFMTGNKIYDFESGTAGNITSIVTNADATNTVTYPTSNPFTTGINTSNNVGKRTAASATTTNWYAGMEFSLVNPMQVDANHKYLHIMMVAPVTGQKVVFNVIQGATTKITDDAGIATIQTANTWQDVVLDVSAMQYISGIKIKCGHWDGAAAGNYYFDEIYLDGNSSPRTNISTGIINPMESIKIYSTNKSIYIENAGINKSLSVYNASGQSIINMYINGNETIHVNKSGLYLVKLGGKNFKILVS